MNIYSSAYARNLAENDRNILQWTNYKNKLNELDLEFFTNMMSVEVLIPIGSRILFYGNIIHTNEVTVAIGADYFVKCCTKQAREIQNKRIEVAKNKIQELDKERRYLEGQVSLTKEKIFEDIGEEIIEPYNEEYERIWKEKHRVNEKKCRHQSLKLSSEDELNDEALWTRLDELEIQEEIELMNNNSENESMIDRRYIIEKEKHNALTEKSNCDKKHFNEIKRKEIQVRLNEIYETPVSCNGEMTLFKRLDVLEEREALEDELDRLETSSSSSSRSSTSEDISQFKKSVSFADENKNECIDINFEHSKVNPISTKYNESLGINKPSDIYEAFPENFNNQKKVISILKNSSNYSSTELESTVEEDSTNGTTANREYAVNLLGDIIERVEPKPSETIHQKPMSKFKQMRMQKFYVNK